MAWGSVSVFVGFLEKENSLETLIVIFENVSPKGFFWLNVKNFEMSVLTANSRYLQTAAFNHVALLQDYSYVLESQKIWYFVISFPSHSNAHDEGVISKNYSQPVAEICWGILKTRGKHRKKVKCCVCTRWQNGEERKKIFDTSPLGSLRLYQHLKLWVSPSLNDITLRYFLSLLFLVSRERS